MIPWRVCGQRVGLFFAVIVVVGGLFFVDGAGMLPETKSSRSGAQVPDGLVLDFLIHTILALEEEYERCVAVTAKLALVVMAVAVVVGQITEEGRGAVGWEEELVTWEREEVVVGGEVTTVLMREGR
ncbi:hypothetical protein Acr_28g0005950 [Actinidia rufa]|uniref:Uncharacterized protein n=1 Tax=Actinidia rufa TaxID=165716 RepID=A0A7J0H9T9_9ERIC|nr:hypothetical protein Acr_28g0005950 [Actinidia rufa]